MTFRPFFIYLASIFILIGCVSGIESSESCKSSADYFRNSKLYHTLLDEKLRKVVSRAARRASNAHDQLAAAHGSEADYWQGLAGVVAPFANYTHPRQDRHMNAMHLHRGKATEHASESRDVLTRNDNHARLSALKEEFELSARHARAGLMHLKASDAYKEAFVHATRVGDDAVAQASFQLMKLQRRRSLNHTPDNAANHNPDYAISNASFARHFANVTSRQLMERERGAS